MSAVTFTRRKFIIAAIILITGIFVVFFALLPFERIVLRILKKDLKSLNIRDELFNRFIKEASENGYFSSYNIQKKWLIRIYERLAVNGSFLPYASRYRDYRSQLVGDFLMSTDFFLNEMDEDREIQYIGFYDPYLRPCSNPFSNLFYSGL
jgi:hypothetical protein